MNLHSYHLLKRVQKFSRKSVTAISFTTIELKSNFLRAIKSGFIKAEATLQHAGKTTQVWHVKVMKEEDEKKTIALFRCTQLILYQV